MNNITLYRPVATDFVSQKFGESKLCVRTLNGAPATSNGRYLLAQKVGGVCPPSSVDFYTRILGMLGHNGIDAGTFYGEPVYYQFQWDTFAKNEHDRDGGVGVDLISKEPILECNEPNCHQTHHVKLRTWHHVKSLVYDNQQFPQNTFIKIALSDSTGVSTGNHVHFWYKWCDASGGGLHGNNGYYGCIKPNAVIYDNQFIGNIVKKPADPLTLLDALRKLVLQLQKLVNNAKVAQ